MKKILAFIFVSFFWCGASYGLDMETCSDYAAKAKTKYAAELMFGLCMVEEDTSFYNRSQMFKCAKKTLNAKTKYAAELKMVACLNKD